MVVPCLKQGALWPMAHQVTLLGQRDTLAPELQTLYWLLPALSTQTSFLPLTKHWSIVFCGLNTTSQLSLLSDPDARSLGFSKALNDASFPHFFCKALTQGPCPFERITGQYQRWHRGCRVKGRRRTIQMTEMKQLLPFVLGLNI